VEIIGHYNPRTEPSVAKVDEERAYYWLGNGAQPSNAVNRIFGWTGTLDRFTRMKNGEDVTQLVQESIDAAEARPSPTKTRHAAPEKSLSNKKSKDDAELDDNNATEDSTQDSTESSEDKSEQTETELEDAQKDVVAEENGEASDDSGKDNSEQPEAESDESPAKDEESNGEVEDVVGANEQTQEATSSNEEESAEDLKDSINESDSEKPDEGK
jgi:small subunit ribosomal protein S16